MSIYLYLLNECDLSVSGTVLWPNLKAAVEKELAMAASTWGSYSTVQYSTVQYSTVQYSTVKYSTVQCSTVQYRPDYCS